MNKIGKSPSEKAALTAAKSSVIRWINEENNKIGIESGPKRRIDIIKCDWDGVDWYIWARCSDHEFPMRVFYYLYSPESNKGHLTPFVPAGTFYEKEANTNEKQ